MPSSARMSALMRHTTCAHPVAARTASMMSALWRSAHPATLCTTTHSPSTSATTPDSPSPSLFSSLYTVVAAAWRSAPRPMAARSCAACLTRRRTSAATSMYAARASAVAPGPAYSCSNCMMRTLNMLTGLNTPQPISRPLQSTRETGSPACGGGPPRLPDTTSVAPLYTMGEPMLNMNSLPSLSTTVACLKVEVSRAGTLGRGGRKERSRRSSRRSPRSPPRSPPRSRFSRPRSPPRPPRSLSLSPPRSLSRSPPRPPPRPGPFLDEELLSSADLLLPRASSFCVLVFESPLPRPANWPNKLCLASFSASLLFSKPSMSRVSFSPSSEPLPPAVVRPFFDGLACGR
mmetsp:Transcript_8369/g.20838  ORF Transcript_8369/g.20838 Transcript_8369/m.20838 type:complete len:347 (-) Transcript_8369:101-1141(-)